MPFLTPLTALTPFALVVVVGHRGAPAELPESTLAGFAVALDSSARADAIELDVRVSKDNVLVVHHDATVAGSGERVRALTFAELRALDVGRAHVDVFPHQRALPGAQIPSLDEVLALSSHRKDARARVLIEIKADDAPPPEVLARLLVDTLDRSGARHRVVVESFDASYVAAVRARAPDVSRGFLCGTCDARALLIAKDLDARIVSPAHDRIDRAFVDAAHARGLAVYAWTANDVASWQRLRALGVDAIITDNPRALRRSLKRKSRRRARRLRDCGSGACPPFSREASLSSGSERATRARPTILFAALLLSGCATTSPANDPLRANVVVTGDGAELFRGKATFGVRSAREGKADRVVSLPGIGEIQTGFAGSATCRLVWSKNGLDNLSLYDGEGCRAPEGGRMCFDNATFTTQGTHAPKKIVVDGCADENDLLWSKLDGVQPATVGPTSFRQRCRKIPKNKGCELTYVKKQSLAVASNDAGDDGFSLAYDGERWRACFLEKTSGAYKIVLDVEDTCGARGALTLEGDSSELDD